MAGLFGGLAASSRLLFSTAQAVHAIRSSRVYRCCLFGPDGLLLKVEEKENPGSYHYDKTIIYNTK